MIAFPKRISTWGVLSVLLLVGEYLLLEYNLSQGDRGQKPLFSRVAGYEFCFVSQSAAAVCGLIAMRRGSKWWVVTVVPAAWLAFGCFFGEL